MEPNDILNEAANQADNMLYLVKNGTMNASAEFDAHLLKTLTVIGWALLESAPTQGIRSFPSQP